MDMMLALGLAAINTIVLARRHRIRQREHARLLARLKSYCR